MIIARNSGLTLLEVVLAVALIAVLAGVSVQMVGRSADSERYEQTRVKMELIKSAIFGDGALDAKGQRIHFGYFGDMGGMPVALSSLTTRGGQTAWAFDSRYGIGAGWRGPYYVDPYTTSLAVDLDAWGTSFVYSTAGTPSLTSWAADKAAGTVATNPYSKDLTMTFDSALRFASVRGFVRDGDTRVPNATVELRYPSAGALTAVTGTSAADGSFTFNTVPPSYAAMTVTSVPIAGQVTVGPRQLAIAGLQYAVPNFLMNYYGAKQRVTIVGTPVAVAGTVTIVLNNSYDTVLTLIGMQLYYTSVTSFISTVSLSGAGATNLSGVGGALCGGTGRNITPIPGGTQQIAANSTSVNMVIGVANAAACTGTTDMTGVPIYMTLQWSETKETDVFSFNPS